MPLVSPRDGTDIGVVAEASPADVDLAVAAAQAGFRVWREVPPLDRAARLRQIATVIRDNAEELAMIDAIDCGNPFTALKFDMELSASFMDYFAGLVTEMKGASVPMGPDTLNVSVREPLGVVVKIGAFNHPFMFSAGKAAAALAAGNAVIVKPADQAPLSVLRFVELIEGILPDGCYNVVTGGRGTGAALASHPGVAKVSLIGSVAAGRAILAAGAQTIKPALLELGGKNALIAFSDADPDEVAAAAVAGMNFAWCGQSCGSTSRIMLHEDIHDAVLEGILERVAQFVPGDPCSPSARMGALVSAGHMSRVLDFIRTGTEEGARLVHGGGRPKDPALQRGYFVEPTIFADVAPHMRIAREEIFGPVAAVMKWSDEAEMLRIVNSVEYGLTCGIWTDDIHTALRTAAAVEAGYVWVNDAGGKHYLGAPFGGYKQSGMGREECLGELLSFTQEKNIHLRLRKSA